MKFSIDNPERGCNTLSPFEKYVWKKRSGELGLRGANNGYK